MEHRLWWDKAGSGRPGRRQPQSSRQGCTVPENWVAAGTVGKCHILDVFEGRPNRVSRWVDEVWEMRDREESRMTLRPLAELGRRRAVPGSTPARRRKQPQQPPELVSLC